MIRESINRLISGYDLTSTDIKEVFDEILSGLADDVLTSSFATALRAKGENDEEISASILAARDFLPKFSLPKIDLIENISFIDNENFIDIPFAMDIVLAACDLGSIRYNLSEFLDFNRSFMTLKNAGVENFNYDENLLEKSYFSYFQIPQDTNYVKYTKNVSKSLHFKNIFNILNKMLNPLRAKNQFIGVETRDLVEKFANICLRLNNENTMVLNGENNFPFASVEGDTFVAEAWKNKIFTYVINPELVGLKTASLDDIKCDNSFHGLEIIKNVFQNKIKGAPYDIIVLNSALALYIAKKAESIMDGILLAKRTIDSNLANDKYNQICEIYS